MSNWARPGRECRHNLAYWRSDDWWGLGPGAHSHVGGVRFWNVKHPRHYTGRLADALTPAAGREVLTADEQREERLLLELRLRDGLSVEVLSERQLARVDGLAARGLVVLAEGRLRVSDSARLLADAVVRELVS